MIHDDRGRIMGRFVEFTAVGAPAEEGIQIICLNFRECEVCNVTQGLAGYGSTG